MKIIGTRFVLNALGRKVQPVCHLDLGNMTKEMNIQGRHADRYLYYGTDEKNRNLTVSAYIIKKFYKPSKEKP